MAYRMFLFDIDGTLTDRSTDKIPDTNVTTLKRLREQGYLVVICTGRMHKAAPMLKEAGVEYDYIIGASGHVIADGNDQVIWSVRIREEPYRKINEYCQNNGIGLFWKYEDGCYAYGPHPVIERILNSNPACYYRQREEDDLLTNCGALAGDEEKIRAFQKEFAQYVDVVHGGFILEDLCLKGISKHTGIEKLLEITQVKREETMSFGDSENDIEMLTYTGVGIAMGDAMEKARQAADWVSVSSRDGGILKALQHFGILI